MSGEARLLTARLAPAQIDALANEHFGDMFKFVADVRLGLLAVGGEFHADGEAALLEQGSVQSDIWGANYYPGRPAGERVEYIAMINIRPAAGNRGMAIDSAATRAAVLTLVERLIGPA